MLKNEQKRRKARDLPNNISLAPKWDKTSDQRPDFPFSSAAETPRQSVINPTALDYAAERPRQIGLIFMADLRALETLDIAAVLIDGADSIVAANQPFVQNIGMSHDMIIGRSLTDVMESAQVRTERLPSDVFRLKHGDDFRCFRLDRHQDRSPELVILRDVTEETSALENVRAQYELRDKLLMDGKIGTWQYDPDTDIYIFSHELSLGHEGIVDPVPTSLLLLLQHPDDQEKDAAIRHRITTQGGTAREEIRYLEADGSWTHLLVHYRAGQRTPSGRYRMFGISQDVTAVARARDSANRNSQRLEFALSAAMSVVFEYRYDSKTFWTSGSLSDFLDPDMEANAIADPFALVDPADQDRVREMVISAAKRHGPAMIEIRTAPSLGSVWVRLYYDVQKRDGEGNPELGVGLVLNIDEQKRQEIELSEAQRAAEFANRTKTEFLANMSHELRTPLNAVLGFSEMISLCVFGPIGEKYLEYARDIHSSGQHLLNLVNDVLDLSKLEAGKLELHESEIDIAHLVDECVMLIRPHAEAAQVTLDIDVPVGFPHLLADERSVKQVLLNLLSNAVKFTRDHGQVSALARIDRTGGILLSVSDNGIGMSPAEIEVALSPFGQVDSQIARKNQGTGLGLPICKSLMELHDGRLDVISKPNKGTTLTACFPASRLVTPAGRRRKVGEP